TVIANHDALRESIRTSCLDSLLTNHTYHPFSFFFFNQKTAYEIGLGIPAEPLFRSSFTVFPEIVPSIGNSFINTMKNNNHTRSSISDDIRNILCSSANMRRAIPLILRLLIN